MDKRKAPKTGTPSTSYSMHIPVYVMRYIIINDMSHAFDIQPTCSHITGNQDLQLGKRITRNCALIDIDPNKATVENIKQICIKTTDEYRNKAVASLIDRYNPYLMIVFCFSKERTKELGEWLGTQG